MKTRKAIVGEGGGGAESADIKKKLSDFDFTPLTVILHILSITILIRCCHSNLLFTVCTSFLALKKQKILNYCQDNYLIKLKFGRDGYFYALNLN